MPIDKYAVIAFAGSFGLYGSYKLFGHLYAQFRADFDASYALHKGKSLLLAGKEKQALAYLQKASKISVENMPVLLLLHCLYCRYGYAALAHEQGKKLLALGAKTDKKHLFPELYGNMTATLEVFDNPKGAFVFH